MKALILYRPNSEHARTIEEFIHVFKDRHPDKQTEVVNLDTREGSATAELYDITQYPSIVAVREDGSVLKVWQGEQMPLLDEVAAYV